tara:strand:+ start:232 stop:2043 length:1812 start_codon:yes stop_codon:yes gene_type:complete
MSSGDFYNDGTLGPTNQNVALFQGPMQPDFNPHTQYLDAGNVPVDYGPSVDDQYAIDITKYVPPGLRGVTQTLFDNDLSSITPIAGIYRGMDASGRIGKALDEGEEVNTNDMLTAGIETAIPALTLGLGKFMGQPAKQAFASLFGFDVDNPQTATNVKPSNETQTFYKGSPVVYDPEPGFPLGRDRSDYSGTGEGNLPMGSPEALGEVPGVHSGKAWGAGDYQTQSPGTGTGYRFMHSGTVRDDVAAASDAAQARVDFIDAGGTPSSFPSVFSERIDFVNNARTNTRLGRDTAETADAGANKTAAERILSSDMFDTRKFEGDPRRSIDPQGFNKSVVFDFQDKINQELYAIRDLVSNRGKMDFGDPEYVKMRNKIDAEFPNLNNLSDKELVDRSGELKNLNKEYTGDTNATHVGLTRAYKADQDAIQAQRDLMVFEKSVTGDLPGALYKTEIGEDKLGSFFNYDDPIDSQILTQATNALGVDAMNAKLFGTGPNAKKLKYNEKTQQYSLPESKRRSRLSQDLQGSFPYNPAEKLLAPQTVAEAKLYRDASITHGQHKTGNKYKREGDRVTPIYNKVFFADDVTPVPVAKYRSGGYVDMGLGSL